MKRKKTTDDYNLLTVIISYRIFLISTFTFCLCGVPFPQRDCMHLYSRTLKTKRYASFSLRNRIPTLNTMGNFNVLREDIPQETPIFPFSHSQSAEHYTDSV